MNDGALHHSFFGPGSAARPEFAEDQPETFAGATPRRETGKL